MGQRRNGLSKTPFGQPFLRTTPSPLLWRTPQKQHEFKLLGPDFPVDVQTLVPRCLRVIETQPCLCGRPHPFFGADVHDPKGSQKHVVQKKFALMFWPLTSEIAKRSCRLAALIRDFSGGCLMIKGNCANNVVTTQNVSEHSWSHLLLLRVSH